MPEKKVSVVVVNFNGLEYLSACLPAVFSQTYPDLEVILVDNGSSDGSAAHVKKHHPQVILLENPGNLGFSRANNQGIEHSRGEFVLTLNNDCLLEKNFLAELVPALEQDRRTGSASGKVYRLKAGEKTRILDTTGHVIYQNRRPANRGQGETDHGQYDQPGFIFQGSAVACLYRREMLEDIRLEGKYFDETFFAFYEDFDLGWRAQIRGWKHFYQPRAVGYHWKGQTIRKMPRLGGRLDLRNWHLLLLKNDCWPDLARNLPQILLYDLKRFVIPTLIHPSLLLGWVQLLLAFPRAIRQHNEIKASQKISDEEIRKYFLPDPIK